MKSLDLRAWLIEDGRWLNSVILCPGNIVVEYNHPDDICQLRFVDFDTKRIYYPSDVEITQSTCKKDMNSNVIYQGDFVMSLSGAVEYVRDLLSFGYFIKEYLDYNTEHLLIIGNKFENPAILEALER